MSRAVLLASSDPRLREATECVLLDEQSAVAAALSAYLWACATQPGVLLSSVSVLVAGFGARRAVDGRLRQPGSGLGRPRGFVPGAPIPFEARAAVPANIPALFVAWGYGGGSAPAAAFRSASAIARRSGAEARAQLLARAAEQGGTAWQGSVVARELVRIAGPARGGLISREDFTPSADVDHGVSAPAGFPWAGQTGPAGSTCQAVIAIDRRGTAAVVCYDVAEEGIPISGGELISPLAAEPVLRGVTRVRPGTPLPQRCDGCIEIDPESGRIEGVASGSLRLGVPR
jgi:gamma-glutamyltranspeptidase/glutathione hydrolase